MQVGFFRVSGFPQPDLSASVGDAWPHPRTISNLFDVDDATHFPLLDSRTRYWRYYLLFRPGDKRQTRRALGRLLHEVIRANDPERSRGATERRLRGVGRSLYEPSRHLSPRNELRVADRFRSDYGPAVKRFWKKVEDRRRDLFVKSGARWRAQPLGFFEPWANRDGHARNAFHDMLVHQSPVAEEFAPLLLKDRFSDVWALKASRVGWSSFDSSDARRVFLARTLPFVLFRRPEPDEADVEDDDEPEIDHSSSTDWLRSLAEACLRFLTHSRAHSVRGRMTATQASELVAALRSALRRSSFQEPFPAPARKPGQLLQTLFPAHRLNAFHRLLHATA